MWRVTPIPVAATTLNAGDIAFQRLYLPLPPFSPLYYSEISGPGTTINFTDNGWLSTNVFGTGEQTITWTAPAGGLPSGTEFTIQALLPQDLVAAQRYCYRYSFKPQHQWRPDTGVPRNSRITSIYQRYS